MRHEIDRAAMRALNRTGQQTETQGVRAVARDMGLTNRAVRSRLTRKKATPKRLTFILDAFGAPKNIASFKASRQTKRGVSSQAYGIRRIYPRTFLLRGSRGGAMKRLGKARTPIRPVWGPGVASSFEKFTNMLRATARSRFPRNLDQALAFALRKYRE